jgi:hypothetical protein
MTGPAGDKACVPDSPPDREKYGMTDLRTLAEAASSTDPDIDTDTAFDAEAAYINAASPKAILALLDERDALRRDFLEFAVHQDGCHLQSPCWCGYQEALDRVMAALGPKP